MHSNQQQCHHSQAQLRHEIREVKCSLQIETAVQFFPKRAQVSLEMWQPDTG